MRPGDENAAARAFLPRLRDALGRWTRTRTTRIKPVFATRPVLLLEDAGMPTSALQVGLRWVSVSCRRTDRTEQHSAVCVFQGVMLGGCRPRWTLGTECRVCALAAGGPASFFTFLSSVVTAL